METAGKEPVSEPKQDAEPHLRPLGWVILINVAILAVLIGAAVFGFIVWSTWIQAPMPEAMAALQSDETVTVETGDTIVFKLTAASPSCGLIFYQGGRVDARAYAPAMRAIAEQGYLVLVPSMPFNLAIFAPDRVAELMDAYPEIEHWVVGGHSLGGVVIADFVDTHAGAADGLLLLASYPDSSNSLADQPQLEATSVYGSLDGVASLDRIRASRSLLPVGAEFVEIEGGNHGQFGWYGDQRGDNPATISREEQQSQTVAATVSLLDRACADK